MISYNYQPKHWRKITAREFSRIFFMYILKPAESRQIHRDYNGNRVDPLFRVRLWETTYKGWEGLGIAMAWKDEEMQYFAFGDSERWKKQEGLFAAQFAGDNS